MKVDIKGNNPITGDDMKNIINGLNKEYEHLGIQVKNMTCYIRFQNEIGETVEPITDDGAEIIKKIIINKTIKD